MPRRSLPLRGIAIDDPRSIGLCELHEAGLITLGAQLMICDSSG